MATSRVSMSALTTIRLKELVRVAKVMRAHGEVLNPLAWLKVLASLLSGGKSKGAPKPYRSLTYPSLTYHLDRCGVLATDDQVHAQIAATTAWLEDLRKDGRPFRPVMSADTIGRELGITDEIREAAEAWNIGVYGGSPKARANAKKERDRQRKAIKRRSQGAVSRKDYEAKSLSRTKPWCAERMSRAAWYRKRQSNGQAHVRQVRRETSPARQYRNGETSPAQQYLIKDENASARSPLEALGSSERSVDAAELQTTTSPQFRVLVISHNQDKNTEVVVKTSPLFGCCVEDCVTITRPALAECLSNGRG